MQYLLYLNSISFRVKGLKEDSRIQAMQLDGAYSDSDSSSSSEDEATPRGAKSEQDVDMDP
jgi:hypothetical protein